MEAKRDSYGKDMQEAAYGQRESNETEGTRDLGGFGDPMEEPRHFNQDSMIHRALTADKVAHFGGGQGGDEAAADQDSFREPNR